ncbi:MAG TPA: transposase [Streptosporangiaceae bacterium]|nr:transposase [Streptosporangiaceae bacterium]
MAKSYRPVVRDQLFLLPQDMREWLPADHPVWLVIEVIADHLDTPAFHAGRRTGGAGTAGYDPDMLLTVLVWAYAHGVTSSRRIEGLSRTDAAYKIACGGNTPDHATIARFRAAFPDAIAEFFAQVLILLARLGMGRLGTVALDGTKIRASASGSASRSRETLQRLARETAAAHAAQDAAEDALFGDARGDEVPPAWSPRRRGERIRAALADLEHEQEQAERDEQAKAEQFRERREAGERTGCSPASAAVALAEENLARATARQQARIDEWQEANARSLAGTGRPLRNPPRQPASAYSRVRQAAASLGKAREREAAARRRQEQRPAPVRNITDPDSRLMPVRGGGFVQGYNAQNVTSQDGLIIATELTQDPNDTAWWEPMMNAAQAAADLIDAHRPAPAPPAPASQEDYGAAAGQEEHRAPGSTASGADGEDPAGQHAQDRPAASSGIGLALGDAGYCSEANLTAPGPPRLIATGKRRDLEKAARGDPPASSSGSPAARAMAQKLKTEDGITAYRQRGHIAETPHGNIKHNMGIDQLSMRGLPKARAEWAFACTIHNLLKAISTGHLTTQALTALAR